MLFPLPNHPLYDASLRLDRADKHISEAQHLIGVFGDARKQHIVAYNHGDIIELGFIGHGVALPAWLPVVLSDAVHNLRSALDYLVYELALNDSKKIQYGTQFMIEDIKTDPANPKRGFDGRKKRYLAGLSDTHVNMIEDLQPYKGVEWTKTLRDISNPDKHRTLTALDSAGDYHVTFDHRVNLRSNPIEFTPDQVNIDAGYAVYIAPADRTKEALLPTLRRLQFEVAGVLELFKPEFTV